MHDTQKEGGQVAAIPPLIYKDKYLRYFDNNLWKKSSHLPVLINKY
jgi:hypothetical protein